MDLYEFIIRMLVATAAGGALGLERESSNKSAGLRTNTLVAVGASIFVMISTKIVLPEMGDPSRVLGQIVTGIGFLGAGVILHRGANVKGLTTAATIWCSAALGSLAGFGFYWETVSATLLIIMINTFFKKVDYLFKKKKRKIAKKENDIDKENK